MLSREIKILSLMLILGQFYFAQICDAHGRMLEPPARNTLWRFGFKAPANYNDNELFCGGIGGIIKNGGKCGICGDPYDGLRVHETGNSMALNETTRNYFPGSTIDLMIEVVANHGGTFKFEICWRDSWEDKETEDCFEELKLSSRSNSIAAGEEDALDSEQYQYDLDPASGSGIYTMSVELPLNQTCENCILRWHWRSANNWGVCEDGTEKVGVGTRKFIETVQTYQ